MVSVLQEACATTVNVFLGQWHLSIWTGQNQELSLRRDFKVSTSTPTGQSQLKKCLVSNRFYGHITPGIQSVSSIEEMLVYAKWRGANNDSPGCCAGCHQGKSLFYCFLCKPSTIDCLLWLLIRCQKMNCQQSHSRIWYSCGILFSSNAYGHTEYCSFPLYPSPHPRFSSPKFLMNSFSFRIHFPWRLNIVLLLGLGGRWS